MPGFTITRWADGALVGQGVAPNPNLGESVEVDILNVVMPPDQWNMLITGQFKGVVFAWDEEEP